MKYYLAAIATTLSLFSSNIFAEKELAVNIRECKKGIHTKATRIKRTTDSPIRIVNSKKGETHALVLDSESINLNKTIGTETKRTTRIASDAAELGEIINTSSGLIRKDDKNNKGIEKKSCIEFTQNFTRSKISITAFDKNDTNIGNYTLITGPTEHWYLSSDMAVNGIKQLDYDSESGRVVEKEKPANIYLGLNYKLGDVFTNYKAIDTNNLSIKILFSAPKPTESVAVGIGYAFKAFDLFVAKAWTADDEDVSGKKPGYTDSTIVGLSFPLSKLGNWLSSED